MSILTLRKNYNHAAYTKLDTNYSFYAAFHDITTTILYFECFNTFVYPGILRYFAIFCM